MFNASTLIDLTNIMPSSAGVLSDESGALIIKPCTAAEVSFYEITTVSHPDFAAHIPTFYGTLQLGTDPIDTATAAPDATPPPKVHNRNTSIVLSSLAYGFKKPCILDIKLGAQLWDEGASLEKRARLDAVSDKTTSRSMGLRLAGMKVYRGLGAPETNEEGYKVFDKWYGRDFTADTVMVAIKEYFTSELTTEQVKFVAGRFLEKVTDVRKVLEGKESRMYSASLLFSYEGDKAAMEEALKLDVEKAKKAAVADDEEEDEEEDEEDEVPKKVEDVKMIDFAHATWTLGLGPDENLLHGVRNVEKLLGELIELSS